MQRFVLVSVTHPNNRPAPVIQPHQVPNRIVPRGEGATSTLMSEAELQKLRHRVQLKALWRELEEIVVSSTEPFQTAWPTLQTRIEAPKKTFAP